MRQLMRTARMLEAEWRQVLWGSVGTGTKEDDFYFVQFHPAVYVYLILYYFSVSLTQPIKLCEYFVQIIMLWLHISAYSMPSSGNSGVLRYN
jgi:hypothetical protein